MIEGKKKGGWICGGIRGAAETLREARALRGGYR